MKYQEAFTKKYKISASELLEQISTKFFGNIKRIGLEKLINEKVEEKGIDPNKEFYKMFIEAIAEGNIKLPENQKLFIEYTKFEIPNKEVSIPKSKGVLQDFKEIVATDDMRPAMRGVYISEDGFLVATDAHILVKYQSNEFSEEKGKIIDLKKYIGTKGKAIDFIDEKYPQYDRVIPQDNEYKFKGLSTYAFYNFAKSTLFLKKLTTSVVFTIEFDVKGEKYYINPNLFSDLLEFALAKGFTSFDFEIDESKSRALVLRFEEKSIGLIMPILAQESNGTIGYTFDQIENEFGSSKSIGKKKAPAPKSVVPKAVTSKEVVEAPKSVAQYKKFEGDIEDTEYISRREIASITLRSGEVLSGNDIIDGVYRAKKKFAEGGEVGEINIAKQYGKMLNDLSKEKQFNKKIELNSKVKNFEKQNEISIDQNNIIYIKGNRVAYIDKINSKTGQQKTNWEIKKFAKGGEVGDRSGSLKVNKESDAKYYWTFTFSNGKIEKSFQGFNTSADAQRDFQYRSKYFAKGGDIGFIPMELEEKLALLSKWGGTNVRGVIGLLNAMIDSGITDEDLKYTLLKKETRLRREKAIEMKIDEIWTKIQPKYNQELKGNMYYSTLKELITRSGGTYQNLLQKFKPFRKYQKFAEGGEVDRISVGDNVYAYFAHNYVGYQLVESPSMGEPYDGKVIDIINENNQKKYVVKFENGETKKLSQGIFDDYVIKEKFAKGGEIDGLEILDKSDKFGEKYDVFVNGIKQGHISKSDDGNYFAMSNSVEGGKSFSSKFFDSLLKAKKYVYSKTKNIFPLGLKTMMKQMGYAKGGKVGFEGLAKKVAKRYVGRKVSKEYQAEYGKTYDAKEAKEVGNKVAGKVYQQQVAKKKIVRKLQRKTN